MKLVYLNYSNNFTILSIIILLFVFLQLQSFIKTSEAIPDSYLSYINSYPTYIISSIIKEKQSPYLIMNMSGNFTNRQTQNGIVTWIQDGSWELNILGQSKKPNYSVNGTLENTKAIFNASFTMIKPDGSFSHTHLINNFVSNSIVFKGKSIFIKGISDIHSTIGMEFKQVPISLHIIDKKILKILIDVGKTNWHFSGPNEIQGTIIKGIGLDNGTKLT